MMMYPGLISLVLQADKLMAIEFVAKSKLPTAYGDFDIHVFQDPKTGEEHVALSKGGADLSGQPVLVRIHSECLTGMLSAHSSVIVVLNCMPR